MRTTIVGVTLTPSRQQEVPFAIRQILGLLKVIVVKKSNSIHNDNENSSV